MSNFLEFSPILYILCSKRFVGGRMTGAIMTMREVAELLKINEKTAYKLALAGEIPGFKVGGSWRFERQAIARWIKRKAAKNHKGTIGTRAGAENV